MSSIEPSSLLEMFRNRIQLPECDRSEVHYPAEGARRLARMEENHFWFTERRAAVQKLLKRHLQVSNPMGLDVGCGTGYNAVWLTENGIPTFGVDAHPGFAAYQEQGRGKGFLQGDLLKIEPRPEFDFVLLLDVLEHIERDSEFLGHVAKVLKAGGLVVISVPAFSWLWSPVDDFSGHLRRYSKTTFSELPVLGTGQLEVVRRGYYFLTTLPLFFVSRLLERFVGSGERSEAPKEQFPPAFVNSTLKRLLRLEAWLFSRYGSPLGSSLFVVLRKN